jgi:hypothetical protein
MFLRLLPVSAMPVCAPDALLNLVASDFHDASD